MPGKIQRIRNVLAAAKMRYSRGTSWIQFLLNLGIITANIKMFETYINQMGMTVGQAIAISLPTYIIFSYLIGYADEKWGVWKEEQNFAYDITPRMTEFFKESKEIKAICEKLTSDVTIITSDVALMSKILDGKNNG
jgi:hypothetical protein